MDPVRLTKEESARPAAAQGAVRAVPETPKDAARLSITLPLLVVSATALIVVTFGLLMGVKPGVYTVAIVSGFLVLEAIGAAQFVKRAVLPYTTFGMKAETIVRNTVIASERYELALRGASEGFWDYDVGRGEVFFSARMMAMLGYPERDRTENIGFWHDAIHPNDKEGVERTLQYHLERRTPEYGVEYRIRKESGEYLWVEDRGRAAFSPEGKATRVAGVTKDISNIKRVQEVLSARTSELEEAKNKIEAEIRNVKKFQMAVDATGEAVSITTPDAAIVYVNGAWVAQNGWSVTEATGRNPNMLKSDKTSPDIWTAMWQKLEAGKPFVSEDIVNRRKDGSEYQAALAVYPIREGDQNVFFVSICQDITQRKEIDKAKTEFVSLASHQLRTPLSAIRWYSEMLLSKYVGELNTKQKQYVEEIYAGNLRMVDLVNALLNTSRIDLGTFAIDPEDVDPVAIYGSVIRELEPQIAEKKQHVEGLFTDAPKVYSADPKLLRIIFQNFLSNSVKYTPEGGAIAAEISVRDANLYIRVSDNGYGIPKAQQGKIFEKLFRADNVRQKDTEGTGLGMYIVKAIVEVSGGKIWFESEENKGTTFHVLLPLAGMPKKGGTKGLS